MESLLIMYQGSLGLNLNQDLNGQYYIDDTIQQIGNQILKDNGRYNKKATSIVSILKSNIFILVIVQGVFFSCNHKFNTQKNICGFWGVYEDSSYVERSRDFGIVGNVLYIHREGVSLPRNYYPVIGEDSMTTEEKQEKRIELNVLSEKESEGTWNVIGSTPDSVIFIAPNHPLEGRYKVHIYKIGLYEYMILSNDSTYLSCYRGGY